VTIDILYPLVQSLTKSEKRYCRLLASRQAGDKPNRTSGPADRGFLRLFDCLLRHETTGDTLSADLARQFPGATLEPARKYLYRVLMQSLRQFEQDKRVDVRIAQLLQDSQILYERGLVKASEEQLEKAQSLAGQYERGLYGVLAARQQVEQWLRLQFDGVDEPTLASLHARIAQESERSQTALHHAALYETLLHRYRTRGMAGTPSDTLRLNDLLLEEHRLLNRQNRIGPPMRSFTMQQQHLHFQSAYFRMIGDGAGSLRVYRELDDLFQHNPTLWAEQPLYYVQLLEGILTDLRLLKQYDEMPFFIERLRLIDTPVQGLNRTVPYSVLYYSMLSAIDQGQYADAATLRQTHLADNPAFERGLAPLALPVRTEFELLLVRLDVGLGNVSAALQRLNRVLAGSVRSLPGMLATQIRLTNLLLHARLGNADYLSYALRSAERKLKASAHSLTGERLTLDVLRAWLTGRLGTDAVARIDGFTGSPADHQLLVNLDLRPWVMAVRQAGALG
jgi:hypothetical protein